MNAIDKPLAELQTNDKLKQTATELKNLKIGVSICEVFPGEKLPKDDSRWGKHTSSFDPQEISVDELMTAIRKGYSFSAEMEDGYRNGDNFISAQHLGLDFDTEDENSSLAVLVNDPFIKEYSTFLYTSASHTPEKPRARVIFILDKPVTDADKYSQYATVLTEKFYLSDGQCKDAARFWYGSKNCKGKYLGNKLPIEVLDELLSKYKPPEVTSGFKLPEKIVDGERNKILFSFACSMQAKGASEETIHVATLAENKTKCNPPLENNEVEQIVRSALRYEKGDYSDDEHFTDYGNAQRFASKYRGIARFSREIQKNGVWLIWNGKVWERDAADKVYELAVEISKDLFLQAAQTNDLKERESLAKWAISSQSGYRITEMVSVAGMTIPEMKIRSRDLDTDIWMLNCQNGIVNLKTGEILPHDPNKFMSKIANGNYIPGKTHPLWEKVLNDWTHKNDGFKKFLQRMAGYTLIGENLEEKFFLLLGETNTGKSTFTGSIAQAMGDYAISASVKTFLASEGDRWTTGQTPRPGIVRLVGARLVYAGENDKDAKLNEAMVKHATGRDVITARDLYSSDIEFLPAFKPWFFTNFSPEMSADDDAIWRRVVRVPFEMVVPEGERDTNIKSQLKDDQDCVDAVLTWAIEGCLKYQKDGLPIPGEIKKRTLELRNEMDALGKFLQEETKPGKAFPSSAIYSSYETWCEENGENLLTMKEFKASMEKRGYVWKKGKTRNFILGIELS